MYVIKSSVRTVLAFKAGQSDGLLWIVPLSFAMRPIRQSSLATLSNQQFASGNSKEAFDFPMHSRIVYMKCQGRTLGISTCAKRCGASSRPSSLPMTQSWNASFLDMQRWLQSGLATGPRRHPYNRPACKIAPATLSSF
jgi:hypothetical protein